MVGKRADYNSRQITEAGLAHEPEKPTVNLPTPEAASSQKAAQATP
jgi:hypothetical protein